MAFELPDPSPNRQQTSMLLDGFTGRVMFRGNLGEFWPYPLPGAYIHLRKGPTFGLGGYRIENHPGEVDDGSGFQIGLLQGGKTP